MLEPCAETSPRLCVYSGTPHRGFQSNLEPVREDIHKEEHKQRFRRAKEPPNHYKITKKVVHLIVIESRFHMEYIIFGGFCPFHIWRFFKKIFFYLCFTGKITAYIFGMTCRWTSIILNLTQWCPKSPFQMYILFSTGRRTLSNGSEKTFTKRKIAKCCSEGQKNHHLHYKKH